MKRKIISAAVYTTTALAFAGYFDGVYSGEPIIHHLGLVRAATAGALTFVAACLLSLFSLRSGRVCGVLACLLSWPWFVIELAAIPRGDIIWFARYRPETVAVIVAL